MFSPDTAEKSSCVYMIDERAMYLFRLLDLRNESFDPSQKKPRWMEQILNSGPQTEVLKERGLLSGALHVAAT